MSRHAATPVRRDRRSTIRKIHAGPIETGRSESGLLGSTSSTPARSTPIAGKSVSAAELIARHRAAARPAIVAAPAARPLTAAELIARHRANTAPNTADTGSDVVCTMGRRRHAAAGERSAPRLPAFVRPVPLKVITRPALVAAAVIATVAGIEAAHLPASKASAEQGVASTHSGYAAGSAAGSASAAGSTAGSAAGSAAAGSAARTAAGSSSSPATGSASTAPSTGTSSSGATTSSAASTSDSDTTTSVTTRDEMPLPSATSTTTGRTSRAKRTSSVTKVLTKPGQTVPGVWVKPNPGPMTSCFCMRWGTMHWGIDLAGPLGSPILSVGDGVVLKAGPAEGFGNWVVIQESNGDVTIYGHMRYYFVHPGQKVKAGQKIALVGDEGQSTGAHLHFEVHKGGLDGVKIDPVPWLKARGISVGPYDPNG